MRKTPKAVTFFLLVERFEEKENHPLEEMKG